VAIHVVELIGANIYASSTLHTDYNHIAFGVVENIFTILLHIENIIVIFVNMKTPALGIKYSRRNINLKEANGVTRGNTFQGVTIIQCAENQ
jgi:hypothetical protein